MLIILVVWLYASVLFYVYGLLHLRFLGAFLNIEDLDLPTPDIILWTGLITITTTLSYISLFLNINTKVHLAILGIAIIYLLLDYKYIWKNTKRFYLNFQHVNKGLYALFTLIVCCLAFVCSHGPTTYDTGLYHAQSVRWIKEFPVVPGLGNLHGRLAFNSSWFLTNAFFDFENRSFHFLNGLIVLYSFALALSGLDKTLKGESLPSNISKCFLLFFLMLMPTFYSASLWPNIPAALLTFTLYLLLLEKLESKKSTSNFLSVYCFFVLAFFAVTVKLSTIPVILFALYLLYNSYHFNENSIAKLILVLITTSSLIVVPWITRNILLSGYLIYPFPYIDLFDVDWKVPSSEVLILKAWIDSWARMPGKSPDQVLGHGFLHWFPLWLKNNQRSSEFIFFELSIGIYAFYTIFNFKAALWHLKRYLALYLLLMTGIIFWFVTSPSLSFGYGFLGSFSLFLLSSLVKETGLIRKMKYAILPAIGCIFILIALFKVPGATLNNAGQIDSSGYSFLTSLSDYPSVKLRKKIITPDQIVYIPVYGDQCWDSPLPCTPYYNPTIEMRGEQLKDGFRKRHLH